MDQKLAVRFTRQLLEELSHLGSYPAQDIPVEISSKHVHLSRKDMLTLFGSDELHPVRNLSQPGQYLCQERVRLSGPKGVLENVAIIGPVREHTQIEISATDAAVLGVKPPVRLSGDLAGSETLFIQTGFSMIEAKESTIIARRHIHIHSDEADKYGIRDGDIVDVRLQAGGVRSLILENVPVRCNAKSALALHIDYDEANAAGCGKNTYCSIVRSGR